jgi:hypothetical protein
MLLVFPGFILSVLRKEHLKIIRKHTSVYTIMNRSFMVSITINIRCKYRYHFFSMKIDGPAYQFLNMKLLLYEHRKNKEVLEPVRF